MVSGLSVSIRGLIEYFWSDGNCGSENFSTVFAASSREDDGELAADEEHQPF